ncbi:FAD:protein FMN transferase [Pseudomonas sp. OIL-1]|uniref:FAD:protein FMN transferase n=1 Tax=Pseudomonas sp. OIL-1 TaxID=2706126 RepID=UPI0013A76DDB|nr:FAD:protein FMN transferase [Pseudomonas sp. OIL-1]QIB52442.1 FAD:protein FMN transferase [Pseudomonas sp. OIL-1]
MLHRVTRPAFVVALAATLAGCFNSAETVSEVYGGTMGSTYSIKWVSAEETPSPDALQASIEALLAEFDSEVSTWRDDSNLARFNSLPAGSCQAMPESVLEMVSLAEELHEQSNGGFDITIGPLLELWGFHGGLVGQSVPEAAALTEVLEKVGQQHLQTVDGQLCKNADVQVDLSAMAAGYVVDRVVEHLAAQGITSYMVEITGELKAAGLKPGGVPWRIAIEEPRDDNRIAQVILPLDGHGVSTSGDYRNYFEFEGKRYSHTFDPRSGQPVMHQLAAVTVLHPDTARADGLSTLLLVKGPDQGWQYAVEQDIAALFVVRKGVGFESRSTPRFKALEQGKE